MNVVVFTTILCLLPPSLTEKVNAGGLHDMLIRSMHDTVNYLGFGVKCRNGGHKTEENTCICPKNFKGKECETKVCVNGGHLEKVTVPTVHHVCKCPHPTFITGEHCERVQCDNSGVLRTFANATWQCDCTTARFYGGKFCERFILSSSWIIVLIFLAVLLIVGFVCSSNWFTRKRARQTTAAPSRRPVASSHGRTQRSSSADDLISSERGGHRRTAAYPEGITQQYVVRLDTIPTFNPAMIGGVEPQSAANNREQTPVGPPPSYDQAMSSIRVEPPEYTPTDATKFSS